MCFLSTIFPNPLKPYFGEIHPCTNKIVYARFEVSDLFCALL